MMKKARDLLGHNLRRLRDLRKWTRADLAEASGLSDQMIQKIEYGRTSPSTDTLDKLSKALGEPVVEFFGLEAGGRMQAERLQAKGAAASFKQLSDGKRNKAAAAIGPPIKIHESPPRAIGKTIVDLTLEEFEDIIARASKRDGTINLENARLKKENEGLKSRASVPLALSAAWKNTKPIGQAAVLYILTQSKDYEEAIGRDLAEDLRALREALGLPRAPKSSRK